MGFKREKYKAIILGLGDVGQTINIDSAYEEICSHGLDAYDREYISGEERWRNEVRQAIRDLKDEEKLGKVYELGRFVKGRYTILKKRDRIF